MLKFLQLLFPRTCVLCGNSNNSKLHHSLDLCAECYSMLPVIKNCCSCCAMPLPTPTTAEPLLCGSCLKTTPPFAKVLTPHSYQTPIDFLITKLKFQKQLVGAKILGILLGEYLQQYYRDKTKPQIIIPIPLHKSRLRERGFNQSLEIARPIAKMLQIPINKFDCSRSKNTQPQSLLSAKERQKNIHNAFMAKASLAKRYDYVAIIDDVITTGDTMCEFCYCLQRTGIKKIDVWAAAHA